MAPDVKTHAYICLAALCEQPMIREIKRADRVRPYSPLFSIGWNS